MGCFTGKYPMEPPKDDIRGEYFDKEIDLERKMLNR
jgi:amidophosphoribosyltransferase